MSGQTDTWSKESGFIWSMIGSAVGFANILSFSALCYKNGGGAFLLPYIIAHLCIGVPMLFLEAIVGQKTRLPLVSAMGSLLGSKGKFCGWLSVITCATIGTFYTVLTAYAIGYIGFTAMGSINMDPAIFFKQVFLKDSGSLLNFSQISPMVLISTCAVIGITVVILIKEIQKGVEKLCSFFLPLLGILVLTLAVVALFLPGAFLGLKAFLIPDYEKLLHPLIWVEAFAQVFFSLSLGLGIVTGYSRHNPQSFSVRRAMFKVALGDFIISFISGSAIFCSVGFLSLKSGLPFEQIVTSDSAFEIGFMIFPTILNQFGAFVSRVIGPIFFFCIFIAGITGVFSIVEAVAGNLEFEFSISRKRSVLLTMLFMTIGALFFCMGNGQHLISALAPMVLKIMMIYGAIAELIIFLFCSASIRNDPVWIIKGKRSLAYHILQKVLFPVLTLSLIAALYQEIVCHDFVGLTLRVIWLLATIALSFWIAYRFKSREAVVLKRV